MVDHLNFFAVIISVPASVLCMVIASRWVSRKTAISLTASALVICIWLFARGVEASCAIDESECIGATATAYLIGLFWFLTASVGLVSIWLTGSAGKYGSESSK